MFDVVLVWWHQTILLFSPFSLHTLYVIWAFQFGSHENDDVIRQIALVSIRHSQPFAFALNIFRAKNCSSHFPATFGEMFLRRFAEHLFWIIDLGFRKMITWIRAETQHFRLHLVASCSCHGISPTKMCYQVSLINVRNEYYTRISWPHNHVQIHSSVSHSLWWPLWNRLPHNERPLLNGLSAQYAFRFEEAHQTVQVRHSIFCTQDKCFEMLRSFIIHLNWKPIIKTE